jgi:hypothetical protein
MKRTLIAVFAVLALAFANPSATSADKPDNPGNSQQAQNKDNGNGSECRKKGCGQPHGQSCKNPNPHKTWCGSGRDGDGDDDGHDDDDNGHADNGHADNNGVLANTGV